MPAYTTGRITIEGDAGQILFAQRVYSQQVQSAHIQDMLDEPYRISFHTNAEFRAKGFFLPSGRTAWGHVVGRHNLWINSGKPKGAQRYALEHEPFHPYVSAHMTPDKRKRIMPLVVKVPDATKYQNRLSEILCDCGVELWWGRGSILDDYYGDIPDGDLAQAFAILAEPNTEPVEPEVPPEPLPVPDPAVAEIHTELDAALAKIAAISQIING